MVVGGGEEALRKVRLLLKTDARIAVIAPALERRTRRSRRDRAHRLARQGICAIPSRWRGRACSRRSARSMRHVAAAAHERGIPVNAVDAAEISTFITPSIVDRDPVVVAIGTEGTGPVLAQGHPQPRSRPCCRRASASSRWPPSAARARRRNAARTAAGAAASGSDFFFGSIRESFLAGDARSYARELESCALRSTPPRRPGASRSWAPAPAIPNS